MFNFNNMIAKACVAVCLIAGVQGTSQAQTSTGRALATGLVVSAGVNLTVRSHLSFYNTADYPNTYYGVITMSGSMNGKSIRLQPTVVANPEFNQLPDGAATASASGDTYFEGKKAMLFFTWHDSKKVAGSISWRIVEYKADDEAGSPTGLVLFASGSNRSATPVRFNGQLHVDCPK